MANVEPGQGCFVYYLFEDYSREQTEITKKATNRLREFGKRFGNDAAFFAPDEDCLTRISDELRSTFTQAWWELSGKLPGLMVARSQLIDFKPGDEFLYLPIGKTEADMELSFKRLSEVLLEVRALRHVPPKLQRPPSFIDAVWDRVTIEPSFFGLKLRLKSPKRN
ncbi:hypothetical protein U0030_09885 [Brevundimonas bullata]|uniref:hypothetical protein n=1 Tax=Brevundimonas bullata TaxID=13160 RepID=UPI0013B3D37D|nr:hypothetical protein [Brevundimonas bullata]WQE35605.1 hypothetical protein U0030_09885 [Brevundimonas bullata]